MNVNLESMGMQEVDSLALQSINGGSNIGRLFGYFVGGVTAVAGFAVDVTRDVMNGMLSAFSMMTGEPSTGWVDPTTGVCYVRHTN